MEDKKEMIIVRGVPGSGKTTFAKSLKPDAHIEADMYMTDSKGQFRYAPSKLSQAHSWCIGRVNYEMSRNTPTIVVSNTFIRLWEIDPYIELGRDHGYSVSIVEMTGSFKNIHGVPDEKVEEMRKRFESYPGAMRA